jgi:hypothetical protein
MPSLDDMPDQFQTDLTLGWKPNQSWQFTAQSLNTLVLDSAEGGVDMGNDISKGQLSVVRYLNKSLSLQLSGWETLAGDDTLTGANGFDAVVWLRY